MKCASLLGLQQGVFDPTLCILFHFRHVIELNKRWKDERNQAAYVQTLKKNISKLQASLIVKKAMRMGTLSVAARQHITKMTRLANTDLPGNADLDDLAKVNE